MGNRLGKILNFCIISMFFVAACAAPQHISETTEPADDIVQTETAEQTSDITQTETPEEVQQVNEEQTMNKLNKVAVVIARDRYQSLEFNPIAEALTNAGYEIIIASDALGAAAGTQETTEVEVTFENINTDELLSIVLIGGSNSLWDNAELHAVLQKMQSEKKIIGAICYGSVTLANAGVIKEGELACWFNSSESDPVMQSAGVVDSTQDVTITGRVITGDGPSSAKQFAEEYVNLLDGE